MLKVLALTLSIMLALSGSAAFADEELGNLQQFIADLLGTDSAEKQTAVAATFIFGFLITLKNFRIFNTSEKYMRLSAV